MVAAAWGFSRTCPMDVPPGDTGFSWTHVQRYNRFHLPDVRKGWAENYFDDTMQGYACILGAQPDPDGVHCLGTLGAELNDAADNTITVNEPNDKVYLRPGFYHTEIDFDGNDPSYYLSAYPGYPRSYYQCDYDKMVEDRVRYSDWVNQLFGDDPAWRNVR